MHKARSQYYFVLQSLNKSTSQYYFGLQSLHKTRSSTTLYYKACTKHFPVLLCTTKLAQSSSQYYFALQSLHKALPSTTLYCKACTKHFPVLLCATKLAQVRRSTTLYYKPWTKYVPVLLCTTMLAQRKLLQTASSFAEKLLESFRHSKLFKQRSFYTECFYTWQAFIHTQKLLHGEAFTHTQKLLHTEKLLHAASFYTQNRLHTASFYRKVFTQRSFLVHMTIGIAAPKPDGSRRQSKKNTILKHFLKGILQGKSPAPKLKNLLTNHYRSLDAATPIRFRISSCKRHYIVLRAQQRHQATLTQP